MSIFNENLFNVLNWLAANKLSLKIDKTSFVLFHPAQKAINYSVRLYINNETVKKEKCIKYLGIFIDSHLSWKEQIIHISKKIKRSVGILSKVRHYINISTLVMLYYTLIYPFLKYAIVAWGNTYTSMLKPLINLQKKAVRTMTFSDNKVHSSPLLSGLKVLKVLDLVILNNAFFTYDFHAKLLPAALESFFTSVDILHQYNTRLASKRSYYLPKIRTNYGKFNIRFLGVKIWNSVQEDLKSKSRNSFKRHLTNSILDSYIYN